MLVSIFGKSQLKLYCRDEWALISLLYWLIRLDGGLSMVDGAILKCKSMVERFGAGQRSSKFVVGVHLHGDLETFLRGGDK